MLGHVIAAAPAFAEHPALEDPGRQASIHLIPTWPFEILLPPTLFSTRVGHERFRVRPWPASATDMRRRQGVRRPR